jgi:hypothetical protein
MTPELFTLLSVSLVAGAAWDVARRVLAGTRAKDYAATRARIDTQAAALAASIDAEACRRFNLEVRFEQHEKAQAELMVDWQLALTEIRQRLDSVTKEARTEVAGTLAAAAQGGSRWRG